MLVKGNGSLISAVAIWSSASDATIQSSIARSDTRAFEKFHEGRSQHSGSLQRMFTEKSTDTRSLACSAQRPLGVRCWPRRRLTEC